LQVQSWREESPCLLVYLPRHTARSLLVITFAQWRRWYAESALRFIFFYTLLTRSSNIKALLDLPSLLPPFLRYYVAITSLLLRKES
jgi:hypothetical protein